MKDIDIDVIGQGLQLMDHGVDNSELIAVNDSIRKPPHRSGWQEAARSHDSNEEAGVIHSGKTTSNKKGLD